MDEPVGVGFLQRDLAGGQQVKVVVAAVDAIGKKGFQPSLARFFQKNPDGIYTLVQPSLVTGMVVSLGVVGQDLAGIRRLMALPPIPPQAVDMSAEVVDEVKLVVDQIPDVRIGKSGVSVNGVPVDHDPATAVDRRQMLS